MTKKCFIVIIALFAIVSFLKTEKAFAGAWTTPKNNLYTEFYNKYSVSDERFLNNGDRIKLGWDPQFNRDKGAKSYAYDFEWKNEYGLADWFDLLFTLPFEWATYKEFNRDPSWTEYTRKSHDIKYVVIGAKARLTQEPLVVSFQTLGYIGHPEANKVTPGIQTGDSRIELRMLLGKSYKLGRLPAYSGFETGYRFRSMEKIPNDMPIFAETGVVVMDWLMLQGEFDNWISMPSYDGSGESFGIMRVGVIYSPTGKFNQFRSSKSHINIALQGGWQVWGRNTNAGYEIVAKISTQFDILDMIEGISTSNHENDRDVKHNGPTFFGRKNDRVVTHSGGEPTE
ncbi:MAG: hypothetical protein PHS37_09860 [Candidatus Omnitrophica bacterium]|nr:hypothetical protein [Candidatus Omnitrophota bacterium]